MKLAICAVALAACSGGGLPADKPSAKAAARGACDVKVRTRAELQSAVDSSRAEGGTVCVRSGRYGAVEFARGHARLVTVRPAPGAAPSIDSIRLEGAGNLRIEGFRFRRGGVSTGNGGSSHVAIVGNRFENSSGSALMISGGDTDITFARNLVRNLRFNGDWTSGWGVSAVGGEKGIRNLRILYNSFIHTEQDAMEISGTYGGKIIGNLVRDVKPPPGTDAHTDSLMLWDRSRDFLIKDNRFEDGHGLLLSGSTSDVRLENNLVVRMANWCQDAGPTGSSDLGVVRYTWVRNTFFDCGSYWKDGGFGGSYGFSSGGPVAGAGNRATHNVLTSFDVDPGQFVEEDFNVVLHGPEVGQNDVRLRPRFRDQIDYQATNLPYDAGYRPAPVGASPCAGLEGASRSRCAERVRSVMAG